MDPNGSSSSAITHSGSPNSPIGPFPSPSPSPPTPTTHRPTTELTTKQPPSLPSAAMDLLTTRKHPSPSQRLLGSLLVAEKSHLDAFLQTLALSHNSNAALAAYASAGRDEGLSLGIGGVVGVLGEESEPWQEAYASALSSTRLALKEIRDAEEHLANVTRDRDILVQRMIKQTKKKPSKSELRQSAAASAAANGRRGSFDTASTSPSVSSFDKTGKLEEAQLELAGCEDTLRRQEIEVEHVRRRVLREIVDQRLRAQEDMGRALEKSAKRGLVELQTYLSEGAPFDSNRPRKPYTPSLESESPSLAPSQSASQTGREHDSSDDEEHTRRNASVASSLRGPRTKKSRGLASVIESSGDSSEDDAAHLQVVENKPRGASDVGASPARQRTVSAPSSNGNANGESVSRRLTAPKLGITPPPAPSASWNRRRGGGPGDSSDSSSDSGTLRGARSTNRKSQSDVGVGSRTTSIARKGSRRGGSPSSSIYGGSDSGSIRKKRGFFASFKHFFVGNSNSDRRQGAGGKRSGSPDSMQRSSTVQWSTRTDRNIRKTGTGGLLAGSTNTAGDSSDEDDRRTARGGARAANLVAVTNVGRTAGKKGAPAGARDQWVVEQPGGSVSSRPGVKRNSSSKSTLRASSLITNPTWGSVSKKASSSDIGSSSKPTSTKPPAPKASSSVSASAPVSRSNTTKSSKSTKTLTKSSTTSKLAAPSGPGSVSPATMSVPPAAVSTNGPKRSASTGAVARTKGTPSASQTPPPLNTLFQIQAPKSNNPSAGLTLPRAPGSSIIPSTLTLPSSSPAPTASPAKAPEVRRQSSYTPSGASSNNTTRPHSTYATTSQSATPNAPNPHHSPNHRLTSAPPRSAMKGKGGSVTSSTGSSNGTLLQNHPPPQMVVAKAPAPIATAVVPNGKPVDTDAESIYETGQEDNDGNNDSDDDGNATDTGRPPVQAPAPPPPAQQQQPQETLSDAPIVRRKSVRMDVPPTPDALSDTKSDPMASSNGPKVPAKQTQSRRVEPETTYEPGAWSTRSGAVDSSDEDQDESEYAIARRAMERATRKFEGAGKSRDGREKGKGRA